MKTDETTWKLPFLTEPPFQKRDTHPNIRWGGGEETMFTCIRIKLCNFYPRSPIKSKIVGKILFQKHVKTSCYHQFSI